MTEADIEVILERAKELHIAAIRRQADRSGNDPRATLVLCSTALGAALIPARRASAVNPTEALRFE
jgi:hypothetical protein